MLFLGQEKVLISLIWRIFLGGKTCCALIAAPNGEMRKWKDKGQSKKA
jgi:hypothetical protein